MSTRIEELMPLPQAERVELALALWVSLGEHAEGLAVDDEKAVKTAKSRGRDLASRQVAGRDHSEVVEAARRAIGCEG